MATRGAWRAHEDVADLAGAAVWGLVRSAQTDIRAGSCWSIPMHYRRRGDRVALATGEDHQACCGRTELYTARVHGGHARRMPSLVPPGDGPRGWVRAARAQPEITETEPFPTPTHRWGPARSDDMRAIAANFRDIMITLACSPRRAARRRRRRRGRRGRPRCHRNLLDSVGVRILPRRQRRLVAGDVRQLLRMPAAGPYAGRRHLSTVFTTAYYAFIHWPTYRARRVLIHAGGTGGVELAAGAKLGIWVEIVRDREARVSGTPCAPWALTTTISDSRSPRVRGRFRAATGGRGSAWC